MIDTAVVLARGLGTRMRAGDVEGLSPEQAAAASSGHKALMPLGKHRMIDYSLQELADAGITHVVLVVAPEHGEFKDHIDELEPSRLRVSFAVQDEPLGTAHAVLAAEDAVEGKSFLMVNGDNLYPATGLAALRNAEGHALLGFEKDALIEGSNIPADRIAAFALIREEGGVLTDIVEKPAPEIVAAAGEQAMVSMNCFAFTPAIFDACRGIEKSARGEYEIVDAVRALDGVEVLPCREGVLDLSRRDDIAAVEQRLADVEISL